MVKLHYPLTWGGVILFFLIFNQPSKAQISNQALTPTAPGICIGDSTTIVTGSSEIGVTYWLRNNADSSIVDGPLTGNGGPLTFNTGPLGTTTNFHVFAVQSSHAMDFDGVDDIVNTSTLVPWDNSSTLMAWYKSSDVSSGAIFTWGSPTVNNYGVLEFRYVNSTFNYIRFYKPQSNFPAVLPHPNNPTDWHHVAIVQDGNSTHLYLDGQLSASGFVPSPTNPSQTSLGAGLFNGSIQLHYDGLIDEFSYWDTVLSPTQIQQYMNTPLAGNESNLSLYYSFESVNGSTLPDLSPTGNHGQMVNMAANPLVPGVFPGDSAFMNQIITIGVDPVPNVTAGPNQTVCSGDSVTLTGGGAASYSWDNNVVNGVPFVPASTTTYTLTGTNGSCSATAQTTITVDSLPNVSAGPNQTICHGDSVTLSGTGANSYTWDNNVVDGIPFAPAATTTYTVTGTGGNNCSANSQVTITVNPSPMVSAGPDQDICFGDSVTLVGSGANSYTWDNNVVDGIPFAPAATTTYTVTGTGGNNCSANSQVTITVNPSPMVSAGPDQDICFGDSVTLAGSGASTFTWDNNVVNGVPFLPQVNSTYTVTGIDSNGCVATDTVSIQLIMVDASISTSSGTLTANATNASFQWLDCDSGMVAISGATNASFSPLTSGNYAVEVTQMGCVDTSVCENVIVVGMEPHPGTIDVLIFPNPNQGRFRIQAKGLPSSLVHIQVIDVKGRVVIQAEMEAEMEIDLDGAPSGIYFVHIWGGDFNHMQKIVVH